MIKLAVLGSTRGTTMQAIIDAIEEGRLDAEIRIVISNKPDAYILERADNHGIKNVFLDSAGKSRKDFDQKINAVLIKEQVDLVLLIGYMRWLSPEFVKEWEGRILNVHPSLLPAFAGGMDKEVHGAVLASGVKESGCTVHLVDEGKDTGSIIVQKKCSVGRGDTVDSLKEKVQKLEGEAFLEAISVIGKNLALK